MEFAKTAKLMSLIRDKIISVFIADWKPLMDILYKTEKTRDLWF